MLRSCLADLTQVDDIVTAVELLGGHETFLTSLDPGWAVVADYAARLRPCDERAAGQLFVSASALAGMGDDPDAAVACAHEALDCLAADTPMWRLARAEADIYDAWRAPAPDVLTRVKDSICRLPDPNDVPPAARIVILTLTAVTRLLTGDPLGAIPLLEAAFAVTSLPASPPVGPYFGFYVCECYLAAGDVAEGLARANDRLVEGTVTPQLAGWALGRIRLAAAAGMHRQADSDAKACLAVGADMGSVNFTSAALIGQLFSEVARADWDAAARTGQLLSSRDHSPSTRRASSARWVADYLEALAERGERQLLADVAERLSVGTKPWWDGVVARCSAIAGGASAVAEGRRAVELHDVHASPLDRARSMEALGRAMSAAGDAEPGRSALSSARAQYRRIGAEGFVARLDGRSSAGSWSDALRASGLTPAQTRVVREAFSGRTNREIASRLNLSIRTVEVHLRHAFQRLGVRNRTELVVAISEMRRTSDSGHD